MPTERGPQLLALARAAIAQALGLSAPALAALEPPAWLQEPGACFVTLQQHGQLRGCIGSLWPQRTLADDVRHNAVGAALYDQRFDPLQASELAHTEIEVAVLSPLQDLHFDNEAQALAQLRPGVDGVVLHWEGRRATFLPQVWAQLPDTALFMAHLKAKAGLGRDFWAPDVRLQRYTVDKYTESGHTGAAAPSDAPQAPQEVT
jgi:AmmeMemoRadiSam system protein A